MSRKDERKAKDFHVHEHVTFKAPAELPVTTHSSQLFYLRVVESPSSLLREGTNRVCVVNSVLNAFFGALCCGTGR